MVLGLAKWDGSAFQLRLEGVEALQADDFKLGNVIDSLQVVRSGTPVHTDLHENLERLFPSPHPCVDVSYHEQHAEFLKGVLKRIADGSATMIAISASYGCNLVAVCRDTRLTGPRT